MYGYFHRTGKLQHNLLDEYLQRNSLHVHSLTPTIVDYSYIREGGVTSEPPTLRDSVSLLPSRFVRSDGSLSYSLLSTPFLCINVLPLNSSSALSCIRPRCPAAKQINSDNTAVPRAIFVRVIAVALSCSCDLVNGSCHVCEQEGQRWSLHSRDAFRVPHQLARVGQLPLVQVSYVASRIRRVDLLSFYFSLLIAFPVRTPHGMQVWSRSWSRVGPRKSRSYRGRPACTEYECPASAGVP